MANVKINCRNSVTIRKTLEQTEITYGDTTITISKFQEIDSIQLKMVSRHEENRGYDEPDVVCVIQIDMGDDIYLFNFTYQSKYLMLEVYDSLLRNLKDHMKKQINQM